jgi:hypothetical protein
MPIFVDTGLPVGEKETMLSWQQQGRSILQIKKSHRCRWVTEMSPFNKFFLGSITKPILLLEQT